MNQSTEKRIARYLSLAPDADRESIVAIVEYNLDPHIPRKRVNGLVAFLADKIEVYEDGALCHTIAWETIESFKLTVGVGCVFMEYTDRAESVPHLLCRADSKYQATLGSTVKLLNHHLEHHDMARGYKVTERVCPRCGKPYRPGSDTCISCMNKKQVVKRLWEVVRPHKGFLFLSIFLFFVVSFTNLISPYLNRVLVDDFIKTAEPENVVWLSFALVILSILGVQLLRELLSIARSYFLIIAGNNIVVELREMVFQKVQRLSISKISKRTSGELMSRVTSDTARIKDFLINNLPNLLEQGILLIAASAILFVYDWKLAILIILPAPFVTLSFKLFWRFMRSMFHRRWVLNSEANAVLHDIFSGIRIVKAFGTEKRETERFDKVAAAERDAQIRVERMWALINPWLQFFMGIGEFILLYYVGNKILGNEMTLGEMTQFSSYVGMVYGPMRMVANMPRWVLNTVNSVARVFEIIDETPDITDLPESVAPDIRGYIDIENASFGYDESAEVLKKIDLHIKPGEFIGIVGRSGVGKSTLINLIMRMYDVDEGCIKIDGIDIKDISQEALRSQMGVVLQETFLFSGTIYQNIAYAKKNATRDEVLLAAKLSGSHDFIVRLPDGYNTKVGERGHSLSGGERQRIAIARALLHDPKILILDEATASLDTETEKQIQDAIQNLSRERTTIAIAHRLSTLRNATRLVVLDKGRIAEMGTHEELIALKGIYYHLVMAQREMSKMMDETA